MALNDPGDEMTLEQSVEQTLRQLTYLEQFPPRIGVGPAKAFAPKLRSPVCDERKGTRIFSMLSPGDIAGLPIEEYGFPGPLLDALVDAIRDGSKTSTTSLVLQYQLENELMPVVGERGVVIDSSGQPVCITEVTEVRVVPLGAVDLAHAMDEGEGYRAVSDWRSGHKEYWHSTEFRNFMQDPNFTVTDATETVLMRFQVTLQS